MSSPGAATPRRTSGRATARAWLPAVVVQLSNGGITADSRRAEVVIPLATPLGTRRVIDTTTGRRLPVETPFPQDPGGLRAAAGFEADVRGCRDDRVGPGSATEEIAVSESTQDRPEKADEKAPKPGEQDTETVAGQPRKAPESTDGEQSKQDE